MKDLRVHLYEQMGMTLGLGFTIDDELAADYIYAFQNDDWESNGHDHGHDLKDIDLWWSLGNDLMKYVLQYVKFTGCLGETTDWLEVIKMDTFDNMYIQACDVVSNGEGGKNKIDDDWGHYVLCYKGHKPFDLTYLNYDDWKEYEYAINPRAKWRNMINKTGLEWIINNNENESVWIRNKPSYNSLIKYTGWSIWKNGKCEGGKLAMSTY